MKRKLSERKRKNAKKVKKSEKIDLNFASLCYASKQKLLNRSEAKNLKRKKAKKCKKSEKSKKIYLNFASLCFALKRKLLK
jgi:hypothetical protein